MATTTDSMEGREANPRPEFLDHEHPLKTQDKVAQEKVSERIYSAMKGRRVKVRPGIDVSLADGTTGMLAGFVAPPGVRPEVTQTDIAEAFAGEDTVPMRRQKVAKLIQHPEDMSTKQVQELLSLLCVKVEELRYGDEADYTLPGADTIAEAYDTMDLEKKRLIADIMYQFVGLMGIIKARERAERAGMVRL